MNIEASKTDEMHPPTGLLPFQKYQGIKFLTFRIRENLFHHLLVASDAKTSPGFSFFIYKRG